MRWRTLGAAVALCLVPCASHAQAPGPPLAAVAAARAALSDSARGASMRVVLLTIGQGDLVFERYGHNLLWITDDRTGESTAWDWGVFNFADPGFLRRFLFGNTRYQIDKKTDVPRLLSNYANLDREVIAQELALSPGQRAALDAYVRTNYLEENRFYRYDYYLDNCSTRVRDALDVVLNGAISAAFKPKVEQGMTFRSETLRLNQHNPWLFMGLDLALGRPSDATLGAWEAAFVPMRLRDAIRTVTIAGPNGTMVPLVRNERQLMIANARPAEPTTTEPRGIITGLLICSLLVTLVLVALAEAARRGRGVARTAFTALAVTIHITLGLLASLIVFMWLFTLHAFWAWNPHLLLFTPLSLVVAVALVFARRRGHPRWLGWYHFGMAASGFVVAIAVLLGRGGAVAAPRELLIAWAGAAWLFHLGLGVALSRLSPGDGPSPPAASPGVQMAA